jgi:hypothetical protein
MDLKRLGLCAMCGGLAGVVLGSLLVVAGRTSTNPGLCALQFEFIVGCGIAGGAFVAYGPERARTKTSDVSDRGVENEFMLRVILRVLLGALFGLIVGPIAVVLAGFLIGGCLRMTPCHGPPDFFTAGVFGAFAFTWFLGLPAYGVGAVVGATMFAVLSRLRASLGMTFLITMAVELVLAANAVVILMIVHG